MSRAKLDAGLTDTFPAQIPSVSSTYTVHSRWQCRRIALDACLDHAGELLSGARFPDHGGLRTSRTLAAWEQKI
ncbi:MAG: hypothetical protein Q7V17_13925 [Afipia sp.]|nr:hypothetical protein [Afipia sp.]